MSHIDSTEKQVKLVLQTKELTVSFRFISHVTLNFMDNIPNNQIKLFRSLFRGREDVFAIRWEKPGKSGYMPAHSFDPYHFRIHKMNGGNFQNYPHKTYLPLSDHEVQKHLKGVQQIGVYPLLEDNTSWFLVADFDKGDWRKEATTFLKACASQNIPGHLERSRSGNGGHVWIFFEKPFPALRSRKIFISILEESGVFSRFDKNSSFDRLFPNQDIHKGKGLGNLISLPFFKPAMDMGNSCFINVDTFEPVENQWQYLNEVERVSTMELDDLFHEISRTDKSSIPKSESEKLTIILRENIRIQGSGSAPLLIQFLKEELNFANAEYFIKKNSGRSTHGTARYFGLVEEKENEIHVPRGFIGKLLRFCKEQKLDHEFKDRRKLKEVVPFVFNATLRSHQEQAIKLALKKDFGIIVAPPGSGKTIMGLKLIAEKRQPALIVVHRRLLLVQWQERIQAFQGIPKHEIGIIGQGKAKIGKHITVTTIQSLSKHKEKIQDKFGLILVDECHHIPAETFRKAIESLQTYYIYGLTATPFRKNNDDKLIFAFLGEPICEVSAEEIENFKHAQIIVRNTGFEVSFNSKTDKFETLSKILVHDSERNKLILKDIKKELSKGKRIAIITERKEHIDTLHLFLKQSYEVVALSGDDSESSRKSKWQLLQHGNYQVLITTGQYFGEGMDLPNCNTLFLVYPFSFKGKLIQYMGRVQRSEITPTIYDYRDLKIESLNKLFLKRNTYYRQISRQATLFDDPGEFVPERQSLIIDKQIKIPIGDLDFRYGSVGFLYTDKKSGQQLDLEIENEEFRPEFEVLKPYFIKVLKSKFVTVDFYVEIEHGVILSQLTTSSDIENINKEVVEGVKFRFLNQGFIGQAPITIQNILTVDELKNNQSIYTDAESVLNDLLQGKQYKHSRHIQYLANRHRRDILKLRFVLQPFSFVFLIVGAENYHIVLETGLVTKIGTKS